MILGTTSTLTPVPALCRASRRQQWGKEGKDGGLMYISLQRTLWLSRVFPILPRPRVLVATLLRTTVKRQGVWQGHTGKPRDIPTKSGHPSYTSPGDSSPALCYQVSKAVSFSLTIFSIICIIRGSGWLVTSVSVCCHTWWSCVNPHMATEKVR